LRYVDTTVVQQNLPNGWTERAQEASEAVAAAPAGARADEVKKYDGVWKELKEALKRVSHGKCWYCESTDIRSDNAVDHFRPKNAVAECPDHGGYWWLAFDWKNYRFCCTFCNCRRVDQTKGSGGGKADHFPLRDEARRAKSPADDLANEEPLLLDPTVPADPGFLWFDETGQAIPNPQICGNPEGYGAKRATQSLDLYHLNHTDLVERRKAFCSDIRTAIGDVNRYFKKYDEGNATAREAFENAVRDLRGRLSAKAEYSATARSMLMGLRGSHPVVDAVLASA